MARKILIAVGLCTSLLAPGAYAEEALDPEVLFADAMKYRKDGDLFKAIELLETILSHQPNLSRARLELAVSYHITRRYNDAKKLLTTVLNEEDTPDEVKLSITAYLAQLNNDTLTSDQRSSSSMFFSAGAFTDSNINLGPGKDFTGVTPESQEKSGSGGQFMFTYAHRARASQALHINKSIVDFEWLTQATAYSKAYVSGNSDFNLSILALNTGPALIATKSWRAALNFKLDKILFGNDDYAEYVGINPLFTYTIVDDLEITFENRTTAREYDQQDAKGLTGTKTLWAIDVAKFYPNQGIGLQAGIKYHDNGAKDASLHFTGAELYFGGQMAAWTNANAYMTISTRDYGYKAPDGTFSTTTARDDTEILAVLGVSHNFKGKSFLKSWTLNAQYTFTDNSSNINEFEFDRNIFEINLRRYFL